MSLRYISSCQLPTSFAIFTLHGFEDAETHQEHVALTLGEINGAENVLTRVHSECLTGDAFFSLRCDCGSQLMEAMKRISLAQRGIILYLRQEGRGIGLINKIRAYHLQDGGLDTVEANQHLGFAPDLRHYEICRPMLDHLGVRSIQLLTNNPRKVAALTRVGINISARESIIIPATAYNQHYLETKAHKLGHLLMSTDQPT